MWYHMESIWHHIGVFHMVPYDTIYGVSLSGATSDAMSGAISGAIWLVPEWYHMVSGFFLQWGSVYYSEYTVFASVL